MKTQLEFSFLHACQEAVFRQQELVPLLAHHLGVRPDGSRVTSLPPEFQDYTKRIFWDAMVCQRWILSEQGNHTANTGSACL